MEAIQLTEGGVAAAVIINLESKQNVSEIAVDGKLNGECVSAFISRIIV